MATAKQIATYTQVCMRKGVSPKDISAMSNTEASVEMQRVFELVPLASEKQINILKEALQEVLDMGVEGVKMPTDAFFNSLNQERASHWIQKTFELKSKNLHIAPPSKEQIAELVDMYLCPVIPWEAIPVTRTEYADVWNDEGFTEKQRITIQEDVNIAHELIFNNDGSPMMVIDSKGNARQAFRRRTRDEFADALKTQLKHADAARILDEYKGEFIRWERTRITDGQIKMIQKLESDLSSVYNPKASENEPSTTDIPFGDADMPFTVVASTPSRKGQRWNPQSFNPTPLDQLKLMDKEQANQYIRQLESERGNTDIYRFGEGQYAIQFTNKKDYEGVLRTQRGQVVRSEWNGQNGFIEFMDESTFEDVRQAKTASEWRENEFVAINNLLFQMQAVGGYDTEEMRNEAANTFFSYKVVTKDGVVDAKSSEESARVLRGKIRELMMKLIKDEYITFTGMMDMCSKSELAQEIFMAIE